MGTSEASTVTSFLKPGSHFFFISQETLLNSLNFVNLGHAKKQVLLE